MNSIVFGKEMGKGTEGCGLFWYCLRDAVNDDKMISPATIVYDKYKGEFFNFWENDNPLKKVEKMLEDDYGMIDGNINNVDCRKDDDEKKHSVMDKIQKKKKEAAVAENNAPKPKEVAKKREAELS